MHTSRPLACTLLLASALAAPRSASADTHSEIDAPQAVDDPIAGWFRIDTDSLGTQFWLGATHSIGSVAIASDIYVVGSFAELDVGPSFSFGHFSLTPMVGIGFDFSTTDVASLIAPQLFTIYSDDKIYFESWAQVFLNEFFSDGAQDSLYTRNYLLYKLSETLALGPQVELSYTLNDNDDPLEGFERGVSSVPIGGHVDIGYGENNTLGLFLGYETQDRPANADGVVGRFTFVRTW